MSLIRRILTTGDIYYIEQAKFLPESEIFDKNITPRILFQF